MWATLKKNVRDKEIAARPQFIKYFDTAKEKHFEEVYESYEQKTHNEQEAKESLWRNEP